MKFLKALILCIAVATVICSTDSDSSKSSHTTAKSTHTSTKQSSQESSSNSKEQSSTHSTHSTHVATPSGQNSNDNEDNSNSKTVVGAGNPNESNSQSQQQQQSNGNQQQGNSQQGNGQQQQGGNGQCTPTTSPSNGEQYCVSVPGKQGLWYIDSNCNQYPCASTTSYMEQSQGSCGCGSGQGEGVPFPWQYNYEDDIITAAPSMLLFSQQEATWCGTNCGQCFQITPTGGFVQGEGSRPSNMEGRTIMVTNLCPPNQANAYWCLYPNTPGYMTHFDLMSQGVLSQIGWDNDNPEVYYVPVECPASWKAKYNTCKCVGQNPYYDPSGLIGGKGAAGNGFLEA